MTAIEFVGICLKLVINIPVPDSLWPGKAGLQTLSSSICWMSIRSPAASQTDTEARSCWYGGDCPNPKLTSSSYHESVGCFGEWDQKHYRVAWNSTAVGGFEFSNKPTASSAYAWLGYVHTLLMHWYTQLSSNVGPLKNHANCHSGQINLKGYRFSSYSPETGLEEKLPISPETTKSWLQSMSMQTWFRTFINFISALRQPKQPRSSITHSKGLYAHDTVHRR